MSQQRQNRRAAQAANKNPENVTILLDNGVRQVIPWEEYKEKYLQEPTTESDPPITNGDGD